MENFLSVQHGRIRSRFCSTHESIQKLHISWTTKIDQNFNKIGLMFVASCKESVLKALHVMLSIGTKKMPMTSWLRTISVTGAKDLLMQIVIQINFVSESMR